MPRRRAHRPRASHSATNTARGSASSACALPGTATAAGAPPPPRRKAAASIERVTSAEELATKSGKPGGIAAMRVVKRAARLRVAAKIWPLAVSTLPPKAR